MKTLLIITAAMICLASCSTLTPEEQRRRVVLIDLLGPELANEIIKAEIKEHARKKALDDRAD